MLRKCPICGNAEKNKIYEIAERRVPGDKEYFRYLWCSNCGTLSLNDKIDDLGFYYQNEDGNGYYAYIVNKNPI